jgi:hypothetical protein
MDPAGKVFPSLDSSAVTFAWVTLLEKMAAAFDPRFVKVRWASSGGVSQTKLGPPPTAMAAATGPPQPPPPMLLLELPAESIVR